MKKTRNKLASGLLAFVLLFGLLPLMAAPTASATAAGEICVLNLWLDPNDEYPIAGQEVVKGKTPVQPDNPAREGMTFLGWYTDKSFQTLFDFSQPMYADADIYARFVPDSQVCRLNLWFDPNDAYPVATRLFAKGDIPVRPYDPGREGETFFGWYTDTSYKTLFDFSRPIYEDTDIYARFVPNDRICSLILWFDPNDEYPLAGQDVEIGTPPVKPEDPAPEGKIFLGWYTDKNFTTLFDFTKPLYEDTNIYARFVPAAPTLSSAANTASGVKLTWSAVPGAAKYAIYRKSETESKYTRISVKTTTSYVDQSAVNGTFYYYRIWCLDAAGKTMGDWSNARGITCQRSVTPTLTSIANTPGGVQLTWGAVPGVAKYAVYRKAEGESKYSRYTVTAATSYTDKNAVNGTFYYYRVWSLDASGKTLGEWSNAKGITCVRNTTPTISSVANTASGVKLTWGAVNGVAKYAIYRKAEGESKYKRISIRTTTSYVDQSAVNGTFYYYRIWSMDSSGNTLGEWSNARGITCNRPK